MVCHGPELMAGDMAAKLDVLQVTVDGLDETVERLDESIRGNGEGLVTKVALMERRVVDLEEFIGEFKAVRRWFMLGALAFCGTAGWNIVEWYLTARP